ncbi:hypothetical protein JCM6882_009548 [Rhodosporidiobolus microsporus]
MSTSMRAAKASYHPGGYGVSEGLKRARKPFFTRNLITGGAISAFAIWVYLYSIRAVAQDDFSDLDQPVSEEQRRSVQSIEESKRAREALSADKFAAPAASGVVAAVNPLEALPAAAPAPAAQGRSSVLSLLRGSFGGKGADSKLVWGAPNVDRVGRIGEDVPAAQLQRRLV